MLHSMYLCVIQWQLHRIPVHHSGLVHGVWWTGGLGPGSRWILVRNPSYSIKYKISHQFLIFNIFSILFFLIQTNRNTTFYVVICHFQIFRSTSTIIQK